MSDPHDTRKSAIEDEMIARAEDRERLHALEDILKRVQACLTPLPAQLKDWLAGSSQLAEIEGLLRDIGEALN